MRKQMGQVKTQKYPKQRVEAISDGIFAIIMTILVIGIPLPDSFGQDELLLFAYQVLVFGVSFFLISVYWRSHFYLFQMIENVSNRVITWNFVLLMCLALIPLLLKWVMEHPFNTIPAVAYASTFIGSMLVLNCFSRIIMNESENPKVQEFVKQLNEKRLSHSNQDKKTRIRMGIMLSSMIVPVMISYYVPIVANVLLVGMPLVISLVDKNDNRWDKLKS